MMPLSSSVGPLAPGARVVVVGGGPGGSGAALALKKLSREAGREIHVTLFEAKTFAGERHFNQCVGVLSPPIDKILEDSLGVPFPHHIIQRRIAGYILHSNRRSIHLDSEDPDAFAVRRIQFDGYLMEQARAQGVEVTASRVTDLEIHEDHVTVYSDSGNSRADAVIGAFGLDEGTAAVFERATKYLRPRYLSSIVTKLHPSPEFMEAFGNRIHAFLPSTQAIEFGGVTPKGNHLTMNIAGKNVDSRLMNQFLNSRQLQSVVRLEERQRPSDLTYFRGRFPISPARAFAGHRYVIIGDAAGLVRPFKGKGVNSAIRTGTWAAETMMTAGISRAAFREYHRACREITDDLFYGKAMRAVTIALSNWGLLDAVIELAEGDPRLRRALFDAVSAHRTYRTIVLEMMDVRWMMRMLPRMVARLLGSSRS